MRMIIHPLDKGGRPEKNQGVAIEGASLLDLLDALRNPLGCPDDEAVGRNDYISKSLAIINQFDGWDLSLPDNAIEERAKAFFQLLIDKGLADWSN